MSTTTVLYPVAPYVGAWIETFYLKGFLLSCWSHPTWVRGLKPYELAALFAQVVSHPTWVRGLKLKYLAII